MNKMKIRFWGVRGSIPTPGPDTSYFGGNTSCVQVLTEGQDIVILDAGTGIRALGIDLLKNHPDKKNIHLLFSHTHWDHIQGLPFFAPLYIPGYSIDIYGPVHYEKSLEEILERQMEYTYFPVRVAELQANISYHEMKEESFELGDYKIKSKYLNHPVLCLGYRFEMNGSSFIYCTDHEPYYNFMEDEETETEMNQIVEEQNDRLAGFLKETDLLVMDSQYTEEEYESHKGWGHSSTKHSIEIAIKSNVKRFALFHHDPDRTDKNEKEIIKELQKHVDGSNSLKELFGAREGLIVEI